MATKKTPKQHFWDKMSKLTCTLDHFVWSIENAIDEYSDPWVLIKYNYDQDFAKYIKWISLPNYMVWSDFLQGWKFSTDNQVHICSQIKSGFPEWKCIDYTK